ncbi:MAG TPA: TonB-dependent receptor [Methylophilaceae bacterium]|nr:TonB-dependent receptor [Methylophilaceae bacterium]
MNFPQHAALQLFGFVLLGTHFGFLQAEEQNDNNTQPHSAFELPTVTVTANPLGVSSDELVVPISTVNGRELNLRRESTLGETLNFMPGVSSRSFGPNASRPAIRGLDSDRIRIMQNGIGVLDASSLSFDHAVAIDPLIVEQIDVVRGPAALLYGGSAVGGVVNAIDHRIPKEALDGITGRSEVRTGGPENQKSGAVVIDAGNGLLTFHADAYRRETDDLDIPGYARSKRLRELDPQAVEPRDRLINSASEAHGGALGASLALEDGHVGLSYSTFDNLYGTVAEPGVRIDQNSDRWDFSSEIGGLDSFINRVKVKAAHTDYMHQEIEDGEIATTFKNRGVETSVEAGHANIGRLNGVIGFQLQNSRFEALGDEAFVPSNSTLSKALYIYEELPLDILKSEDLKLSFGTRAERVEIESEGGARFGQATSANFNAQSMAAGALYDLNEQWSIATNLSHNERAPSYFELFANGPHLATAQYEVGDADLDKERSNGIDVQLRWKTAKHSFKVGAFYTRFSNFISLANTDNTRGLDGELNPTDTDEDGMADISGEEILPEAQFMAVPAVFKGLEAEAKFHIYEGSGDLDLNLRGDYVHATNRDTGEPLPRISPLRLGFGLDYSYQKFGSRLEVLHAFKQDRTAENELETDDYTLVNVLLAYRLPSKFHLEAFAKGNNLLDQEIREHSAFLKDIAPLGERSLLLGLRGEF